MREAHIPFDAPDVEVVRYQNETGGGFRNERVKLTPPPKENILSRPLSIMTLCR